MLQEGAVSLSQLDRTPPSAHTLTFPSSQIEAREAPVLTSYPYSSKTSISPYNSIQAFRQLSPIVLRASAPFEVKDSVHYPKSQRGTPHLSFIEVRRLGSCPPVLFPLSSFPFLILLCFPYVEGLVGRRFNGCTA